MGRGLLLRRYLINRGHLSRRTPRSSPTNAVLATLSGCCPPPKGRLSTCYSPVRRCTRGANPSFSLNLHVLGLPLTFALSQDQTLHLYCYLPPSRAVGVDDVSSDFIPTRRCLARRPGATESGFACWHKTHNSSRYSVFKDRRGRVCEPRILRTTLRRVNPCATFSFRGFPPEARGPREGAGFYHFRREREGLFRFFFGCLLGEL